MKLTDDQTKKLMQQATVPLKTASLPSFLQQSIFGNTEEKGKNYLDNVRDEHAADETKGLNKFFKNIQGLVCLIPCILYQTQECQRL